MPSGVSRAARVDPGSFVGTREVQQRTSTEAGRRYRTWLDLSRKLQADPRVLVYYSFEGQQPWDRTLLDQAIGRGLRRDGGIVGCEWTEGRWPGKAALDFKRRSDRVRVEIRGRARCPDPDDLGPGGLFRQSPECPAAHRRLGAGRSPLGAQREGILIFIIKNGPSCHSPVVLGESQLGLWTHLATVYAPARRLLTHYVNGRGQEHLVPPTGRVVIGSANLGNYTDPPPDVRSDRVIRNLNGRM